MSSQPQDSGVRLSIVRAIYFKEIREILRDRRTLFLLIAMPVIFYPLLMVLIAEVAASQASQISETVGRVAVTGAAPPSSLVDALEDEDSALELVTLEVTPDAALASGDIEALVVLGDDFSETLRRGGSAPLTVRYNSVTPLSASVLGRVKERLKRWQAQELERRLQDKGLDNAYIEPLDFEEADVAPPARQLGSIASQILPILVLIFMVAGAFYPAIDLTAGERERKTIQTLLSSPVRPLEVVCGKYLTVFTVAMISGMVNLLSMVLIIAHNVWLATGADGDGPTSGLGLDQVSAVDIFALTLAVTVLGLMFSALLMTIATLASSPKEAQNYLSPVYMLCMVPVFIAQIPGVEMSQTTAFIPVLNLALLMKEILIFGVHWEHLFLVSLSSLIVTVLTLAVAAKLYTREELIIGRSGARGLLSPTQAGRRLINKVPDPGEAMALVALMFVGLYYVGSMLQSWSLLPGLLLTLFGLLLVPTLALVRWRRYDPVEVFNLRRPPWMAMLGAALLGTTSFIWVSAGTDLFHETFMPVPESFIELMEKTFAMPDDVGGKLGVLMVVALAPAICEEAVFRGWLLSSFRGRTSGWVAVVMTALFFGAFHLSIYRFLGTATLGLLMGYMVWHTRSIWPAVLFHLLNNSLSLLSADLLPLIGLDVAAEQVPVWLVLASLTTGAVGLALIITSVPAHTGAPSESPPGDPSPPSPDASPALH